MENSNNTEKMIGALLVGAAIGGALGILFAPDKGINTRRKISRQSEDLTDAMKEKFNSFIEEIKAEIESVKVKAGDFVGHAQEKAEKMKAI